MPDLISDNKIIRSVRTWKIYIIADIFDQLLEYRFLPEVKVQCECQGLCKLISLLDVGEAATTREKSGYFVFIGF